MFLGHYAVALAAKKAAPKVSLGTLLISAQLVDLLLPLFLLLGLEHIRITPGITAVTPFDLYDYPYSHSLLAGIVWSIALGLLYYAVRKEKKGAFVVALAVFSHWILDFITHRPDLSLGFGGGTYVGLGLWNSVPGTLVVELALYIAGIALYLRTTTAKDRIGSIGFWSLFGLLAVIYLASVFGPPPPDTSVFPVAGIASWLFILWAYWVDKHRTVKTL